MGDELRALRTEIERQCDIGAGTFTIDDGYGQSGLWQVNADLDPNGLKNALATRPAERDAEGWLPIESAPKDGTAVLLWDGFYVFQGFWNGAWETMGMSSRPWVKAWMPLPAPPLPTSAQDSAEEPQP